MADPGTNAEPVEAMTGVDPVVDTSAGAADVSPTQPDTPALVDWNGEVAALKTSDWYRGLDPKVQDGLLRGIETKYQNYEKRYKPAYEAQSKRQKEMDEREARILAEERRVMRLWIGDEDPMAAKQAEIDTIRKEHATRVEQIVAQHRAELDGAKKPTPELEAKLRRLDELEAKLVEVDKARGGAEARLAAIEKAETDAALDAFEEWLGRSAPHIIGDAADPAGFDTLIRLIDGGMEPERALRMVLAEFPSPEPKPVAPPPGIRAMGKGNDARTERQEPVSLHEAYEKLRRDNQQTWSGR